MIHVTRNSPSQPGMYGVTEPQHATSAVVQPMRNDVALAEHLRAASVDEAVIQEVIRRLQHKGQFAQLTQGPSAEWIVEFGNQKEP